MEGVEVGTRRRPSLDSRPLAPLLAFRTTACTHTFISLQHPLQHLQRTSHLLGLPPDLTGSGRAWRGVGWSGVGRGGAGLLYI